MKKTVQRVIVATSISLLSLIAVALSVLHFFPPPLEVAIANNFGPSPAWFPEQMPRYNEHWFASVLHIIPGALLVILAPIQLSARIRNTKPGLHRFTGRVFILIAIPMTLSAMYLAWTIPFGGDLEKYSFPLMAVGFLFALGCGIYQIRQGNRAAHRLWMSRMLAIAYAPITMRLILLIITSFGVDGQKIFAEAMWLGLGINWVLVHLWIRRNNTAHAPLNEDATGRA